MKYINYSTTTYVSMSDSWPTLIRSRLLATHICRSGLNLQCDRLSYTETRAIDTEVCSSENIYNYNTQFILHKYIHSYYIYIYIYIYILLTDTTN